jgi:GlcNAc-P-P-Und epimerase
LSRIAITGGSGFIGTNLVQYCFEHGHEFVNIDIVAPRNPASPGRWAQCDIVDAARLREVLTEFDPEILIHLAARTDLDGRTIADYTANTMGVRNVIEAAKRLPRLKRTIFASSMFVCRLGYIPKGEQDYCPHTVYGESKVEGERIVRQEAGSLGCWVLVRPTSIWGPWFAIPYSGFFEAVRKGMYMHPKGVQVLRSYGFVANTVYQIMKIAQHPADSDVCGKTFYIADYEPTDTQAWADRIAAAFGRPQVRQSPLWLMRRLARGGDLLKTLGMHNPPLTSFRLQNLLTNAVFDLSATRNIAGDLPYSLEQGVATTAEWMKTKPA